ncbi:MAG: hypothetical protein OSB62_07360 [Alphaproteobacteria bacterium]|nr:hypothetical protein [Alphaproteobacteria bacterium]
MNIKINTGKTVSSASKKKKTSQTGKAGGVSFGQMVDAIKETDAVSAAEGVDAVESASSDASGAINPYNVPQDARGRGKYMLDRLEDLEKDILSGSPTDAIEKLRHALDTEAIDRAELSPKLIEILDEIDMRVSVEVAKLEAANEK